MHISVSSECSLVQKFLKNNFSAQIVLPEIAKVIGLEETIVLLQVNYWLQRSQNIIDGVVWVYNTYEQWQQQFSYWSLSKIKRVFAKLHKQGLLISQKKKRYSGCHTKWYSINYAKLSVLLEGVKSQEKSSSNCSADQFFANNGIGTQSHFEIITSNKPILINSTKGQVEVKNFALVQNELSSGQNEPIITKTNLTDSNKSMSNELCRKKQWLQTLGSTRQTEKFSFSKEDMETSDQLIKIWSSVFINEKKKPLLHDKRRAKLLKTFARDFSNNLEEWRKLCLAINSSKFLMGEKKEGFKAHFDWLLEEKTIAKIRAGEFDIGDRIPDIEQKRQAEEKIKEEEIAKIKLAAIQAEKGQAVMAEEIKALANRLERCALEEMEALWTEEELAKAKQDFEENLYAEGDPYGLHCYQGIFQESRWENPLINFAFTSFKRMHCLKKSNEDFILEATKTYSKKAGIQYKDNSYTEMLLA
jgi:hypothetical protein